MTTRPLSTIATDIAEQWPNVNCAAKPYLNAMLWLDKITDTYYADSAVHVVAYFLSNASTWKGKHARRIKTELKIMILEARAARAEAKVAEMENTK